MMIPQNRVHMFLHVFNIRHTNLADLNVECYLQIKICETISSYIYNQSDGHAL